MSIRRLFERSGRPWARSACAVVALPLLLATGAGADIIAVPDMARGVAMSRAQCAAIPQTVWVDALGRNFCMRYYLSTAGGDGPRPVVFLQGDKPWILDRATGAFNPPADAKNVDTGDLVTFADTFSRSAKTTAIYLARVGVDGSSGHHRIRHSALELHATNAALDEIKARHGFEGFHLVGQSGGATLVGGLLGLRNDVGCAVSGAGRLAMLRDDRRAIDPALRAFDPADSIPSIARYSSARILVVGDPQDRRVKIEHQIAFVDRLRQAGGRVELYYVQATDQDHHGMVAYARSAVAGCIRGAGYREIAADLAKLQSQRLAAQAKLDAEGKSRTSVPPALQRPDRGTRVSNRRWWQRHY